MSKAILFSMGIFMIMSLVCCEKGNSKLDLFYNKIDSLTTESERIFLKNCENVNCIVEFVFTNTNTDLQILFDDLTDLEYKDFKNSEKSEYPKLVLLSGYSNRINDRISDFLMIEMKFINYFENIDSSKAN